MSQRVIELADRLSVSPTEAAKLLGLSPDTIYSLLNAGKLRSRTVGTRRLIPMDELHRFLDVALMRPS